MQVKINKKLYSSAKLPILLILDKSEKHDISLMSPENNKYLSYPNSMSVDDAKNFMDTNGMKIEEGVADAVNEPAVKPKRNRTK